MKCNNTEDRVIMRGLDSCRCGIIVTLILFGLGSAAIHAEDWPTYMHDNSRSGTTAEQLDVATLQQAWVYTSPAPPRGTPIGPFHPCRPIAISTRASL
jgi:hypothetical protein